MTRAEVRRELAAAIKNQRRDARGTDRKIVSGVAANIACLLKQIPDEQLSTHGQNVAPNFIADVFKFKEMMAAASIGRKRIECQWKTREEGE